MCNFSAPWFGARYPDAGCDDGYLHDRDADGYDPDDNMHPCPRCNTREYLTQERDHSLGCESMSFGSGGVMVMLTGDDIWEIAKRWARQENPEEAEAFIAELDLVK